MTTPPPTNNPPPPIIASPGTGHTFTTRVVDPTTTAVGRINMVWPTAAGPYYRVIFPPGSPYVDDWAVFREGELSLAPPEAAAPKTEAYKEDYPTTATT